MEATNLFGDMEGLGYKVIQFRPRRLRPNSQPAQANILILVREDLKIVRRLAQFMKIFWIGPKHGWLQDPRVYRWAKVRWRARTWKLGGAHIPFGLVARAESVRRLTRKLSNTLPGRPTVLVMDANMSLGEVRDRIGEPADAWVGGQGIEAILLKNAVLLDKKDLGKFTGDGHPFMLYTVKAR